MHQSVMSSAYMLSSKSGICSSCCGKSLRSMLNSVGDRIDPCGILLCRGKVGEMSSICTCRVRVVKKFRMQL